MSRNADDSWGPRYSVQVPGPELFKAQVLPLLASTTGVHHWNEIAINASGLDHTPVAPAENRVFGEQLGPARAARAMAIVHIAIFDVVNAITGGYQSYTGIPRVLAGTSMNAAIAQTAHDTLVALFPSQRTTFDAFAADDLSRIPDGLGKVNGIVVSCACPLTRRSA